MASMASIPMPTVCPRSFNLYVTHVESEKHFLKIWGQVDQQASLMIGSLFQVARESLENGVGAASPGSIHEGVICAAKYKDGNYCRAKIINTTKIATEFIEVQYIDYGSIDFVSLSNIRFLDNYDPMFVQLKGQATEYYLTRVINPSGQWEEPELMKIQSLLLYSDYPAGLEGYTQSLPLIFIRFNGDDLSTYLVSNGLGIVIPTVNQIIFHLTLFKNQYAQNWRLMFLDYVTAFTESVSYSQNQTVPMNPALAMQAPLQQNVAFPYNGSIPATRPLRQPRPALAAAGLSKSTTTTTPPGAKPTSPEKSITYKSKPLQVNSQHQVFVSYAETGPELFAVQLVSEAKTLQDMMDDINKRPLSSLVEPPIIGSVCLGRMSRDHTICRATVINHSSSQCNLFFVDFGDTEMVSYYDIFDIPEEYVNIDVLAKRFCLSGVKILEKGPQLNKAFKELASGKVLTLKVVCPEGPPLIQYGEFYLQDENILDLLRKKMKTKLQFKRFRVLPKGAKHSVLVSYVDSCIKLYIQLSDRINELNAVMESVKAHCENSISPGELAVGAPCCARFPADGNWYRAQVIDKKGSKVVVAYVDYGNEQEVQVSELRTITPELLRLPAIAMKCVLKGFENKLVEMKASNQLEMLALEKTFMCHVVGVLSSDTMLVTLVDDSVVPPLDISSKLNLPLQPCSEREVMPIRKESGESFSSPEGSAGYQRSFQAERRPRDGDHRIPFQPRSPGGSVPEERSRGCFRKESRDSDEDFPLKGGGFHSRYKESSPERDGAGGDRRRSVTFADMPDRSDTFTTRFNQREERDDWGNRTGACAGGARPKQRDTPGERRDNWADCAPCWKQPNNDRSDFGNRDKNDFGNRVSRDARENLTPRGCAENTSEVKSEKSFQDRNDFGNRDKNEYGNRDRNDFSNRGKNEFGNLVSRDARENLTPRGYAENTFEDKSDKSFQDRNDFGNRDKNEYGNRDRNDFSNRGKNELGNRVSRDARENLTPRGCAENTFKDKSDKSFQDGNDFGNRDKNESGNRDRDDFGNRESRGLAKKTIEDNKSDKSFRSQGSGNETGCAPLKQVQYKKIPDPVPLETPFADPAVELGAEHEVSVTWIVSPESFYTQILSLQPKFLEMMHKIPELYKGVRAHAGVVPVGASVLARYPADGVLYRATVLSLQPISKLIVRYVDFGNKQMVDATDIWQLDRQLMALPRMAVHCALLGVSPPHGEWKTDAGIDPCFNAPRYQCVFHELAEKQYRVVLWNDGVSVADTLVSKHLAASAARNHSEVTLKDEPIDMTIIVGQQILCRVTHVDRHDLFSVQLDLEKAARLEETISTYDLTKLTALADELVAADTHCMVQHEGRVCRAVLRDVSDPARVTALLADLGTEITTEMHNVMILPGALRVYYYQALQCTLHNYSPDSQHLLSMDQLREKLTGNKFIVHVNDVDGITLVVTLYEVSTGAKVQIFSPDAGAQEAVVPLCARAAFNYDFGCAYVSHAASLAELYLQRASESDRLALLLDNLYNFYQEGSPEPLATFEAETLCAANSADGNWYRGTVLSVDGDQVKVHFTDYGNSETVAKDSLRKLDPKFHEPCSLALVASLGMEALREDALAKLLEWTTEREVQVTLSRGADGWLASLRLDGVDLCMKLVEEELAAPQPAAGDLSCFTSHVNSPSEFWIQLESDVGELQAIEAALVNADSFPELAACAEGLLCAARYPEDGAWYRAQVIVVGSEGTEVLFIDFGNASIVTDIRTLPDELKAKPALARKCALQKLRDIKSWSRHSELAFNELADEGATVFTVQFVDTSSGGISIVELYSEGASVSEWLVGLCEGRPSAER